MKKLPTFNYILMNWNDKYNMFQRIKAKLLNKPIKGNQLTFDDSKNIYHGEVHNNKPEGFGRMQWANGQIYIGYWIDGKMHGMGYYTENTQMNHLSCGGQPVDNSSDSCLPDCRNDHDECVGTYQNGKMEGFGRKIIANEGIYIGYWANGQASGHGEKHFVCGDIHIGEYKNDSRNGQGKYTWNHGDVYEGSWVDGRMEGYGVKTMTDGSVYDGFWKNDKTHGYGKKKFPEGDYHEGDYRMDVRHGYGTYIWHNGHKYSGNWVNGNQHGRGTYQHSPNEIYCGHWKIGCKHGVGLRCYKNRNLVYQETYNNGSLVSSVIYYQGIIPARLIMTTRVNVDSPLPSLDMFQEEVKAPPSSGMHNMDCCVCANYQRNVVIQPCNHVVICSNCVKRLDKCPICRTNIQDVIVFYLS